MEIEGLLRNVRGQVDERVWGAAVKLAREGAVVGVTDDGDEVHLRVKTRGKPSPFEVYLWPEDQDFGCDCDLPSPCVHVCAAAIAIQQAKETPADARGNGATSNGTPSNGTPSNGTPSNGTPSNGAPSNGTPSNGARTNGTPSNGTNGRAGVAVGRATRLPEPKKQFQVRLVYAFESDGSNLSIRRIVRWPDGRTEPLRGTIAESDLFATRADVQAESLLALQPDGPLSADATRRLITLVEGQCEATLDGRPVRLVSEPVMFRVKVVDEGEGFKVGLYRPNGIDQLFRGAALVGDALRPTSHGDLTTDQKRLLVKGAYFTPEEVGRLVGDYLPRLRDRIGVDIVTERLPNSEGLRPQVLLSLAEREAGLEIRADLVYGTEPVIARVENGVLKAMGAIVPARDLGAERLAMRRFEEEVGLPVGYRQILPPDRAAAFLRDKLPRHTGPRHGNVTEHRFKVVDAAVLPEIEVRSGSARGTWDLDVRFVGPSGTADAKAVLSSWVSGRSLVPLMEGGYAPLPTDWLKEHGGLLRELLEARNAQGAIDRHATAALVELLEDTEAEVPTDLARLRAFLEGEDDASIPEDEPLPDGFVGELRPYQEAGVRWLRFLRHVDLNGVLADDMGLGKTVQALVAMLDTHQDGAERGGAGRHHLVVAPTSVLRNWEREANRFAPGLRVNVYHGPGRKLVDPSDPRPSLTLTSYAILRMDVDVLKDREWTYAILDEAQAIKNPDSQTARSARQLKAKARLCMTGTPVENRLEELWSLFRFLMPGFLGSLDAFRERFARPVENGDAKARDALRKRVRPYVLRRLKQQVAKELPPLTDIVVRCEMGPDQRKIYETVRLAAREDVQRAISEKGVQGATMHILEALLRMRQACCDPALLPIEGGSQAGSCKLDRLEEILIEMVVEDHKALIFSQWTSLLDLVEPRLKQLGIGYVRLDGATRDRQAVIDKFQSADGPPVFLLSLKAGGTGLNLTAADYVVHLDPWWNPAVQQQATDRAHRIGQDKPVVSCRIIAEDTVEERILELQDAKRALADAALGTEGGFLKALSMDELRSLFG